MILKELLLKLGLELDEAAFAKGQLAAELIKVGLEKVVEIGKEVVHTFVENIHATIEYGNRIEKTSQSIGIATDALQELQYAGKLSDLSAEAMSQSIGILSRNMYAAKKGAGEQADTFHKLKIKITDAHGALRGTDEIMGDVADRFAAMEDGSEKTALAMRLFGRAGKQMIPMLNKGSEALAETRKEARELGLVMDEEAVKASEELNDNFERLHMVTQGLWRGAIAPLLPAINELVVRFLEWKKANGEIMKQRIAFVIKGLIKVVGFLGDAFQFLVDSVGALKTLMPILIGLMSALTARMLILQSVAIAAAIKTAAAWALAALPFAAIAAAIAALLLIFEDFSVYERGGKSLFGAFMNSWDRWLKPSDKDSWPVAQLKKLLSLLGSAKDIIDSVGYFFEGVDYFENKARKKQPELFNEEGQYVGRQDITYKSGREVKLRRGAMQIAGETVRAPGSLTGQLDRGAYARPSAELRSEGRAGGKTTIHVGSPQISVGPVMQQPGENGENFANRVGEIVQSHIQPMLQEAVAGVKK